MFFYVPFALLFALLREVAWTPRRLRWAGGVLAGLALAFAGVGFVEFATRRLLLNPKVIASNQVEEYVRVNSLFFDPNIYGRFLALVMIGLAAVMLWARRPRHALPAVAALVVLWSGLLTTLSQSSFAALLVGLAALAWLRWGARVVLPPALAAVAVALLLVLAFPGALHADLCRRRAISRDQRLDEALRRLLRPQRTQHGGDGRPYSRVDRPQRRRQDDLLQFANGRTRCR